ncbi:MAG: DNA polymerase III subunit gamma/tau [Verrucomicrobiota bacterium]|jgi:DNA polymerase-3 subunit delta'
MGSSQRPSLIAWPSSLEGTPAVAVIEQAIERKRLGHSLLLHAENVETLAGVAEAIADRLLNSGASQVFSPHDHPDCFTLRPAGKMRIIGAEDTRELITKVQVSSSISENKVAIIFDAERMNPAAANIFLKTLEEPPAQTTLILLTTRPYALLSTIRSRCLHFRFPSEPNVAGAWAGKEEAGEDAAKTLWLSWLADYAAWLGRMPGENLDRKAVSDHIFTVYGLTARFGSILDKATDENWEKQKSTLPDDLAEDEKVAIETGIANGLRSQFFAEIEEATRTHARARLRAGDITVRRTFAAAVEQLEHNSKLLRLNLNESAALEDFMLSSLRIWSAR